MNRQPCTPAVVSHPAWCSPLHCDTDTALSGAHVSEQLTIDPDEVGDTLMVVYLHRSRYGPTLVMVEADPDGDDRALYVLSLRQAHGVVGAIATLLSRHAS